MMDLLAMIREETPALVLVNGQLPPSGNNYRGIRFDRRTGRQNFFLRPAAKKFKASMTEIFMTYSRGWKPVTCDVGLYVTFYVAPKTKLDLDNHLKVLDDSLNGKVWVDDSQIVQMYVEKIVVIPSKGQKVSDVMQTVLRVYV